MKWLNFILFLFTILQAPVWGQLIREPYEGVRQTGMGNAFIALADDANTLFYNPAGLAKIKQVHFNLFDFILGADSKDTLDRIGNAIFKSDFPNLIREDKEFVRLSVMPTLVVPNFGISFFNNAQGMFDLEGLTSTGVDVYSFNDLGIIMGGAIPIGEYFSIGASARALHRTSVDLTLTPQELLATVGADLTNFRTNIYNHLKNSAGTGYGVGLSAGLLFKVPLNVKGKNATSLTLAATADDIGDTSFTKIGTARAPANIQHSYNFGTALSIPLGKNWVWNNTLDLRHQLIDIPFVKQFHFGSEFRHKVVGLRGGIYQGYGTFGASIEFPPHTRLHFSSYGVELGRAGFEKQHRWYLLQLVIGFNPL